MPKKNKVVRLPSGDFVTTKVTFSTPEDLARSRPEEVWRDGDGNHVRVRDMETSHITNALRSMERWHWDNLPGNLKQRLTQEEAMALIPATRPVYGTMLEELARRAREFAQKLEGRAAGIPDKPNPRGRKFNFDL